MPLTIVLAGSAAIVLAAVEPADPQPRAGRPARRRSRTRWPALLVVIFGFLFVTVSSRICGLIGTSANPVSGMTIATLMATCALFLAAGWTAPAYAALALEHRRRSSASPPPTPGPPRRTSRPASWSAPRPPTSSSALFAGVVGLVVRHRPHAHRHEQGARDVRAGEARADAERAPGRRRGRGPDGARRARPTPCSTRSARATIPEGKYLREPGDRPGRAAVDPGHRQPGRAGAPGAPDVRRHQRHPDPEAALGAGAARRVPGGRRSSCWASAR